MKKNTSWKFTDESSETFQLSISGAGEFGLKVVFCCYLNFFKVVLSNNVLLDLFYHLFFLRLSLDRKLFDFLWFCKKTCQGRDKIILKVALPLYLHYCLSCFLLPENTHIHLSFSIISKELVFFEFWPSDLKKKQCVYFLYQN